METHLTFPDINYLFGALILVISELQLCPVNHKSCRRSWKLVIMTEGDYSTYATHIFGEKFVTTSWNNINHFSILKFLYQNTLLSF